MNNFTVGASIYLASNPGSLFQILSRSFAQNQKLQDKIQNGKPGLKAN